MLCSVQWLGGECGPSNQISFLSFAIIDLFSTLNQIYAYSDDCMIKVNINISLLHNELNEENDLKNEN